MNHKYPDLTIAYSAIGGMVGISNASYLNLIRAFPQKLTIGILTFGDWFKGSKFNQKDMYIGCWFYATYAKMKYSL